MQKYILPDDTRVFNDQKTYTRHSGPPHLRPPRVSNQRPPAHGCGALRISYNDCDRLCPPPPPRAMCNCLQPIQWTRDGRCIPPTIGFEPPHGGWTYRAPPTMLRGRWGIGVCRVMQRPCAALDSEPKTATKPPHTHQPGSRPLSRSCSFPHSPTQRTQSGRWPPPHLIQSKLTAL